MTITKNYSTFPELKNGMFIQNQDCLLGVVAGKRVIYADGSFDRLQDVVEAATDGEDYVNRVFGEADGFTEIKHHPEKYLIWELKTRVNRK